MTENNLKNHVGIDVSKPILDVYDPSSEEHFQVENSKRGFKKLIKQFDTEKTFFLMEATGGYEAASMLALQEAGFDVARLNPRRVRDFARGTGHLAKTDKIDAKVIAMYGDKTEVRPSLLLDENQRELSDLESRRCQLKDMLGQEDNRLKKASSTTQASLEKSIAFIKKQLAAIEKSIKVLIEKNDDMRQVNKILCSFKGIGDKTSGALIAKLPELGQIGPKQVSAIVGVAPLNRDSGSRQGYRSIYGGRACVREALYMAALVAAHRNPLIRAFYLRLLEKGKSKKVALTACMHKMLIILNAMVRDNTEWRGANDAELAVFN